MIPQRIKHGLSTCRQHASEVIRKHTHASIIMHTATTRDKHTLPRYQDQSIANHVP